MSRVITLKYMARASACSNFAISLGLLTPAEDGQLRREFRAALDEFLSAHAELVDWDQPCPYFVNQGSVEE